MARIVVGVTGGVAAFKAPVVVRELMRAGHDVHVVATRSSLEFIGAATWEGITSHPLHTDIFSQGRAEHVELARTCDLMVIVPATATTMARLRAGMADDMLTLTALATNAPLVLAPAMHSQMWEAPATRDNVATLRERGAHILDPDSGALGSGDSGVGRLPDPTRIARYALSFLPDASPSSHDEATASTLTGRRILVSAGGTHESIDPVRFLGNRSSGRQGVAIAAAAAAHGASVSLVGANITPDVLSLLPQNVTVIPVESALDMLAALKKEAPACDALVMCAAVADFRPAHPQETKIKKDPERDDAPIIELVRNPDILSQIAHSDIRPPLVVGFAAETGQDTQILSYGADKARRKGADFIALNRVGGGAGFGDVDNDVMLLDASGQVTARYSGSKDEVAEGLIIEIAHFLDNLS